MVPSCPVSRCQVSRFQSPHNGTPFYLNYRLQLCTAVQTVMPLSHLRGSSPGSLWFCKYFCRRKAAVVSRKIAEGLRFNCGQYGDFTVFAVYLRFLAVLGGCRTAENRGLNRISGKVVLPKGQRFTCIYNVHRIRSLCFRQCHVLHQCDWVCDYRKHGTAREVISRSTCVHLHSMPRHLRSYWPSIALAQPRHSDKPYLQTASNHCIVTRKHSVFQRLWPLFLYFYWCWQNP